MLFGLFITLGVAVLSVALRSYESPLSQKIGAFGILAASYLGIYYITGSWILGLLSALSWLLLPWVEILTRIRALRLPKEKTLRPKSPPSPDVFPTLDEISSQIENEGFAHISDAGWDWADYQQFFRLFYKEEDRAQATICLNEQNDLSFYYLRISSRAQDGTIWTTWNYPLSYGLKLSPHFRINRQRPDQTFWQLYQSHKHFLHEHSVETDLIDRARRRSHPAGDRERPPGTDRAQHQAGRAHPNHRGRDQVFLARNDLSLVPVPARSGEDVTGMSSAAAPRIHTEVQVMFFDTDCAAVVHNIAYLRFIETARTLLAGELGMKLTEMAETQRYPVVVRTEIDYRRPAKLGDQLVVDGWLDQVERVRFWCAFEIKRPDDDALIADLPPNARGRADAGGETAAPAGGLGKLARSRSGGALRSA